MNDCFSQFLQLLKASWEMRMERDSQPTCVASSLVCIYDANSKLDIKKVQKGRNKSISSRYTDPVTCLTYPHK